MSDAEARIEALMMLPSDPRGTWWIEDEEKGLSGPLVFGAKRYVGGQ
jgi:hypothetical protein